MMRIGGSRRKSRNLMSKPKRLRGKVSLTRYFQALEPGQRVALKAEPSVQAGIYFKRFHGRVGVVGQRLGSCYEVKIDDHGKAKTLIVHPVHLKPLR
jgi:large subunit ribosomal protein L21e